MAGVVNYNEVGRVRRVIIGELGGPVKSNRSDRN